MTLPFPYEALDQHLAILGKTGAGKSFTSRVCVEWLLEHNRRVCIIDPTGVHWGVRLNADGKKSSGHQVVIFGGDHGDVELRADAGGKLAEIVGRTDIRCIIDVLSLSVSDRQRFFADFAEALMRHNRQPLHLIIDECHQFMPQSGAAGGGHRPRMLHAANDLVAGGRSRGLRIMLLSQRPAKVHKDSLTQVETLIAMKMIAPQDRKAVEAWIGEWADPAEGKEIIRGLPSLNVGTGWVWAPEHAFLEKIAFPRIRTFDSMKAPGIGEDIATPGALKDVDLDAITAQLTAPAEKKRPGTKVTVTGDPVPAQLREIEMLRSHLLQRDRTIKELQSALVLVRRQAREMVDRLARIDSDEAAEPLPASPAPRRAAGSPTPARSAAPVGDDPLATMARSIWPVTLTWAQLCALCGRKARGGHFNKIRKRLVEEGIVREEGGRVVLADPPDMGDAIPADVLEQVLPNPARQMFAAIRASPGVMDVLGLGNHLGLQPRGGHWNTGMHILRSNDLIREHGGVLSINPELEGRP